MWEDTVTDMDKPWNDVADQLRPARPDPAFLEDEDLEDGDEAVSRPADAIEADPADVADQRRVVPLPDDVAGERP